MRVNKHVCFDRPSYANYKRIHYNLGTRKCSACSLVAYCGPVCQKAHWPLHKKGCKASKGSSEASPKVVGPAPVDKNNLPPQVTYELVQRLQAAKVETQKAFNSGDFQSSVKYGNEALQCARMLPEPGIIYLK